MAAKKPNPGFEFIKAQLEKDKKATYKDIAAAAAKKKLTVFPIMFGRAQTMLGIVKQAKRGQGKAAKTKAHKSAPVAAKRGPFVVKRGPGRPRKNAAPAFDGTLEGIVAAVKGGEQARARYRTALERIQTILSDTLAD